MQIVIEMPRKMYEQFKIVQIFPTDKIIANGIPLPEHGDLIDRNELLKQYGLENATKYGNKDAEQQKHSYSTMMMYEIADMIEDAETIIPATKEKSCETCSKAWTDDCELALCFRNNYCEWKPETKESE